MRRSSFALAILCTMSTGACATLDSGDRPTLKYDCGDVVAVGRVDTIGYTPIMDPDDLLGHGIFEMNVSLKRVIRGTSPTKVVRATRVAHAQMVESRDFVLVLKPKGDGSFELESASLSSHRPKLVQMAPCAIAA